VRAAFLLRTYESEAPRLNEKRHLTGQVKSLGPDDPDVATVLENLAELYKKLGRMDEAKRCWERAQEIHSHWKKQNAQ